MPYHVTLWLDENPNWKGGRRHATAVVKRAFSWAHKEGLLSVNPLASVKIGRSGRRERILSREEREQILAAIQDQAFKDFVIALQETGCRPSEISWGRTSGLSEMQARRQNGQTRGPSPRKLVLHPFHFGQRHPHR